LLTERKGVLKGWTVTLVLATFLLTILGTFMTRSGVFNSVHSFTQSAIGPTIFVFLVLALAWSIALLALRIDRLSAEGAIEPALGRDSLFLVNNLLFVLFTFTVLLGTAFPLLVEALRGVQMSVGRPYFDRMAVPLGVALLLLMGVGPALPWGRATPLQVRQALVPPLAGAALAAAVAAALGVRRPWTLVALAFGGYTLQVTLRELWLPLARRRRAHGESLGRALVEAGFVRGRRRLGSYIVHAGAAVVIVAIAVSSTMGTSREAQLRVGEKTSVGAYTLTFLAVDQVSEPHREAVVARVGVSRGGRELGVLLPRMNQYERQREPIGTPAVRSSLFEDLYLSVMNIDPASGSLGLLAMVNPMVGWIWAATGLMALGSLVGLVPSRP
jgi:cytochrome c-type biogenesis protein CcmF